MTCPLEAHDRGMCERSRERIYVRTYIPVFRNFRHERPCIAEVPFRVVLCFMWRFIRSFSFILRNTTLARIIRRQVRRTFQGWNFVNVKIAEEKERGKRVEALAEFIDCDRVVGCVEVNIV